ncbi:AI-2E family transporter [Tamlana sp. 2_MG-2023]|uniref:AI-2E family transporter n=1 Tax=unclassified Tamlana TaxID=2614803 RepID=UPI0026E3078B|nr:MULTISPECIES: AI-2E family transporter [unclassified Tamlana]MDO6759290.1 AI-2E family transporter [Tamlana sp. 2_MG-2023]MDO6790571.1 AI-2E family transporter [Tamlana sp. 1_MG-2023]
MKSKTISSGIVRAVLTLVALGIFLFFLYEVRFVIAYIAIAAVTALICRPLVQFLERMLKIEKNIAVIITIFMLLGVMIGLGGLFVPLVVEQGHNLSLLDIKKLEANVEHIYSDFVSNFNLEGNQLAESFKGIKFLEKLDFSFIPDVLNSIVSGLGSFSIGLFSVLFISFFFLKDRTLLENTLLILVPEHRENQFRNSFLKIRNLLSRYFVGLICQISILFIIYMTGLLVIGVQNPIVIAFLCALLNLIPYVGPFISIILMMTLTMTSNIGHEFFAYILPKTFWVLVVFMIGQLIDNFVSQPIIFSKSVKSHPLEIFLIILVTGILFGVVGLIIAIPAYTAIKVILKEYLSENRIVKKFTENI